MLNREDVIKAIESGRESECLDQRDYARLTEFLPVCNWGKLGFILKADVPAPTPREWTEDEIKKQLAGDLEFAFEKALNKRGISSSMMYGVIKMWLWILEDELANWPDDKYPMYGLPLFKAVALKYGLPNPIGDDTGGETKYDE